MAAQSLTEHDYLEASSVALVRLLENLDAEKLKAALLNQLRYRGCTANARALLHAAIMDIDA